MKNKKWILSLVVVAFSYGQVAWGQQQPNPYGYSNWYSNPYGMGAVPDPKKANVFCTEQPVSKPKQAGACTAPVRMYCEYLNGNCFAGSNPAVIPSHPLPLDIQRLMEKNRLEAYAHITCDTNPDGSCPNIGDCASTKLSKETQAALDYKNEKPSGKKIEDAQK